MTYEFCVSYPLMKNILDIKQPGYLCYGTDVGNSLKSIQ